MRASALMRDFKWTVKRFIDSLSCLTVYTTRHSQKWTSRLGAKTYSQCVGFSHSILFGAPLVITTLYVRAFLSVCAVLPPHHRTLLFFFLQTKSKMNRKEAHKKSMQSTFGRITHTYKSFIITNTQKAFQQMKSRKDEKKKRMLQLCAVAVSVTAAVNQ